MRDDRVRLGDIDAAYRLILGRDPDDVGLDLYRRRAKDGWTIGQLRDEFLKSVEFRRVTGLSRTSLVASKGFRVSVDALEPDFGAHIAAHGGWEPHIVAALQAEVEAGDVVVDIGANVGVMAFAAAVAVGPTGRVLAFEPHPDNVRQFIRGLAANDFENVTLFPFALSDARATFSIAGSSNGYLVPVGEAPRTALALRGDEILADEPRVDLIKIDIEGHEPFALDGLSATLAKHRPRVLCEFNPRCLVDHIGRAPAVFAAQLFAMSVSVEIVEHDGGMVKIASADELLARWHNDDDAATAEGRLPRGMLHYDLLCRLK